MIINKRMLVCAYFAENVGDDLFLKVLFDRYPNVSWELLTNNKNYYMIFKGYKNIKIIHSYRSLTIGNHCFNLFTLLHKLPFRLKKYDGIIHIGGSIFMQNPMWRSQFIERVHLMNSLKAKGNFIIGANFGPFQDQHFLTEYRKVFMNFNDICFRDSYSYDLFKDLGNVRFAPDVVLSLQDHLPYDQEKSIGISIIHLERRNKLSKYTNEYNQKIAKLTETYIESGYQVKLFSFCEKEGDLTCIQSIKKTLPKQYLENVHIINYTGDLTLFLKSFKSCERIIGTRFHALILAMVYNQPFYPLIYSQKTNHFLADLGFHNSGCEIENIKDLNVKELGNSNVFNHLKDDSIFSKAHDQFKKLDTFIANGNNR